MAVENYKISWKADITRWCYSSGIVDPGSWVGTQWNDLLPFETGIDNSREQIRMVMAFLVACD